MAFFVPSGAAESGVVKSILVIANPAAGLRAGVATNPHTLDEVRAALDACALSYDLVVTQGPGHARQLAHTAVEDGRELVVAAGGDGTVHEVAQSLVGAPTALGILPLGTIMNVARVLGIPRDLEEAAALVKVRRIEQIDVGKVRDEYFLEVAGVGMDAAIFHYLEAIEAGHWLSVFSLIRFLLGYRAQRISIRFDGDERRFRALMVVIANTPIAGPALPLAPGADVEDRCLDVVVYRRLRPWDLLGYFVGFSRGRPLLEFKARTFRAVRLWIDAQEALPVHADGRLVGTTPVALEVVPCALRVVVGTHRHATTSTTPPRGCPVYLRPREKVAG